MKLNELKQGMVCEKRNGSKIVIVSNEEYAPEQLGRMFALEHNYRGDLTSKTNKKEYDIMKVSYGDKVVWERKESTFWLPEKGEMYWYISSRGDKINYINEQEPLDKELFETSLVFKTEEEAEKQLEKQKATIRVIKEIARLNEGWLPNWKDESELKFTVILVDGVYLDYTSSIGFKFRDNNLYLKSKELAEKLKATHEQDLKIMLEVE